MNSPPVKRCANEVSLLPYDLIFKILLLLPAKDLLKLTLVSKTWRTLITSPNFIEAHTTRCETVLTFLKQFSESRPNTFDINTTNNNQFTLFDPTPTPFNHQQLQIHLMEFNHNTATITDPNISGFRQILASCNGLILATNETGTLLILNPTTRKLLPLKSGTLVPTSRDESYGFTFSPRTQQYKAVHVFRDRSGHLDTEILSINTMSWTACRVPTFGLFRDFTHKPVCVSGVVYWLPGSQNVNYLVSMDIDTGKFVCIDLPVTTTGMHDRLIENGGLLNFVAQLTVYRIQLWSLKRGECEEMWVKKCTINMDYDITGLVPVFMRKCGRFLVFKMWRGAIYEYDMEEEEMGKVVVDGDENFSYRMAFTHLNSLVSWENLGPLW